MTKRTYLPQWTDGYPEYDKQYLAASLILDDVDNKESLLPVRFKDDLSRCYKTSFSQNLAVGGLYGRPWVSHQVCIEDEKYAFAKRLYKQAAMLLFEEYQDIGEFEFGNQQENGVYPIYWKYPVAFIKEKLIATMNRLIQSGFSVSEQISCTVVNESLIRFDCVMHLDERIDLFGKYQYDSIPIVLKEQAITYPLEECLPYYVEISEDILELGNQQRIYSMTYEANRPLFDAAEAADAEQLCQLAKGGYNLNAINREGLTPLYIYADKAVYNEESYYGVLPEHIKAHLERLIALGANLAVRGVVDSNASLFQEACVCANVGMVKFLLEQGVNPNMYMFLDDYCNEKDRTLLDWAQAHTAPDFDCEDEDSRLICYTKEICQLIEDNLSLD